MVRFVATAAALMMAAAAPALAQSEKSAGASSGSGEEVSGYPILPTTSSEELLAARDKWGSEPASTGASEGSSSKSKKKN